MLKATAPDWIRFGTPLGNDMPVTAMPPLPGGMAGSAWALVITSHGGILSASEAVPGTRLPHFCPELHVNPGSSFCLGLPRYRADLLDDVAAFWRSLGEYLVNQRYAERRGRWPAGRWLSHGRGAEHQIEAERIAGEAGWAHEYEAWLEAKEGWLAGRFRACHVMAAGSSICARRAPEVARPAAVA
jgi:hypothetical protein